LKTSTRSVITIGPLIVGDLLGSGAAQEREVVGDTLNLAARLQGIADPDSVVIGEGTRKLLGELFELVDLGPQQLKGVAGTMRAFAALRESSQARRTSMTLSGLSGRGSPSSRLRRSCKPLPACRCMCAWGSRRASLRIAEIAEHAVAHVLGDEPPSTLNQARAALIIGSDHLPHILGIEPSRHRCRTNEIAEYHCKLAALGGILAGSRRGGRTCEVRRRLRRTQTCDRSEEPFAIPQGDAKFFEIAIRQIG
jgi:hypothetical protein